MSFFDKIKELIGGNIDPQGIMESLTGDAQTGAEDILSQVTEAMNPKDITQK